MTKQIIITVRNILKYFGEHHVCFSVWDDAACKFKQIYATSVEKRTSSYLSTHTVYQYKIYFKKSLFGGDMAILGNGYRKT